MQITRNSLDTSAGPSDWFTGAVYVDTIAAPSEDSRVGAACVHSRYRLSREEGEGAKAILEPRLRDSRGSCVIDQYSTASGQRYRELACIVAGARSTTVVVGAAPSSRWSRFGPEINRAVESFAS